MSLRYLTAGESHGKGLVGIIEGLPAGVQLDADQLKAQMKRRKLGFGRGARQKIEDDAVEVMAGVRFGKTLGSPVALVLPNKDWKNWQDIMASEGPEPEEVRRRVEVPRPGHADLIGGIKYAHGDMRNVLERASARETAMRVALASIARTFLEQLDIHVASRIVSIGKVQDPTPMDCEISALNEIVDSSPVRVLGKDAEEAMTEEIMSAKKAGDTLGGVFEVFATGVPIGLGTYSQWDRKLEAKVGASFLSLNAIKGVELGIGFEHARIPGSMAHDEILPGDSAEKFCLASNRAGGVTGGMTTGQPLIVRAAMKPIATLMKPLNSINRSTGEAVKAHVERSDVCAVPAAAVIGESLLVLSLAELMLEKFGGDSMTEIKPRVEQWRKQTEDR